MLALFCRRLAPMATLTLAACAVSDPVATAPTLRPPQAIAEVQGHTVAPLPDRPVERQTAAEPAEPTHKTSEAQEDLGTPTPVAHQPVVAEPEALFAADTVHTLTLTYAPGQYAAQQADLTAQLGPMGSALTPAQAPSLPPQAFQECADKSMGASCMGIPGHPQKKGMCAQPFGDSPPACLPVGYLPGDPLDLGPVPPAPTSSGGDITPAFVPVTVTMAGQEWPWVAMRFKGHQSLTQAWAMGRAKLPFRLDFDHYGQEHPELAGRRIQGFEKLTFATGWGDETYLRDVLASEILRDRGVPAPKAAFYRVMVDRGDGTPPVYAGLYIAVEEPSDVLPARDLNAAEGNVYKPDGADWTTFDPALFGKKNHAKVADFSDVQKAVLALHAPQTDVDAWRANLAQVFDTAGFLRWLAVNTALSNLDSYGHSTQNYYLVGVPSEGGRLHWVPWDHNAALSAAAPPSGTPGAAPDSPQGILHDDKGPQWPLIRLLLDDPVLRLQYRAELALAVQGAYASEAFAQRVQALHDLIAPHVQGPQGEQMPYTALTVSQGQPLTLYDPQTLIAYAAQMRAAVAKVAGP